MKLVIELFAGPGGWAEGAKPLGLTSASGRVLTAGDWCLTCQEGKRPECSAHDIVCKPVGGWGACDCRHCKRAIKQMEAQHA